MNKYFSIERKKNDHLFLMSSLVLFACFILSYSIVQQNYYILFILSSIVLGILIIESNVIPLAFILIAISFSEWAVGRGFVPLQVMWAPELMAGLLFTKAVLKKMSRKEKINLFGMPIFSLFLLLTFLSFLYNKTQIVSLVLFLRVLARYYLLFLAILNLDLDEKSMKFINKILIFIFISQIPLSIIKLFESGIGEKAVGLSGHALSAILPLVAIGFLFSYHFLHKKKSIYIFLSLAFVGFSIIGEKRAFIFLLPIFIIYLTWELRDYIRVRSRFIVLGVLIFMISFYAAGRIIPTLNPSRKTGGEFNPAHIIKYAIEYTTSTTREGVTQGRTSSTIQAFKVLSGNGIFKFMLGDGPGVVLKSMFKSADMRENVHSEYGIGSGLNGINWLSLQVGYLGAFIYFLFLFQFLKKSRKYFAKEIDPYWKSFDLGMIGFSFVMIFVGFLYYACFRSDAISAFYFCLIAFVIKRYESDKEK